MRILILLSAFLASTIQPSASVENEGKSIQHTTASIMDAKADPVESTQILDIDTDYLMKGSWRILSIIADKPCDVDGDGNETTNIMDETPICALDDVMKIYPDHTISFERNQRCAAGERALESYRWKLAKDGTFTIIDGTIEANMILKSATASRMVMWIPMEENGEIYNFKVTYGQRVKSLPGKALKN